MGYICQTPVKFTPRHHSLPLCTLHQHCAQKPLSLTHLTTVTPQDYTQTFNTISPTPQTPQAPPVKQSGKPAACYKHPRQYAYVLTLLCPPHPVPLSLTTLSIFISPSANSLHTILTHTNLPYFTLQPRRCLKVPFYVPRSISQAVNAV